MLGLKKLWEEAKANLELEDDGRDKQKSAETTQIGVLKQGERRTE